MHGFQSTFLISVGTACYTILTGIFYQEGSAVTERASYAHLLHKGESVLLEGRPEKGRLMPRRMLLLLLCTLLMLALVYAP